MFRNETKATERRAQKANRKALAQKQGLRPDADPAPADGQGSQALDRARDPFNNRVSVVVPSLAVSPEQHATCHFFANFVLVPHQDGSRGFMDYLVPMMKDEPSDSHLTHAFNACALASLGNKVTANGINFGERALGEYTKALAKTHVSLRDPEASKTDSVLAAVLLLGLFEVRQREIRNMPNLHVTGPLLTHRHFPSYRTSQRSRWACSLGGPTSRAPFKSSRLGVGINFGASLASCCLSLLGLKW